MSDVVFILGAGASAEGGAPLMSNFIDEAENLYKNGVKGKIKQDLERVFSARDALQKVHSKSRLDIDNIESVFTALEMGQTLSSYPSLSQENIGESISSLKRVIGYTIENTLRYPIDSGSRELSPPRPYRAFVELISFLSREVHPRRSVSIITFNYDLACDYALTEHWFEPYYALSEPEQSNSIPLLKLHGSFNWVYSTQEEKTLAAPLHEAERFPAFKIDDRHRGLKIIDILREFGWSCSIESFDPVIVPPTWSKAEHQRSIATVWSRAAKELSEAESIFVIGYSLPDTDHFSDIYMP